MKINKKISWLILSGLSLATVTTVVISCTKDSDKIPEVETTNGDKAFEVKDVGQNELFYKDAGKLKYDDKWWDAKTTYSESVVKGKGKAFYANIEKNEDNKYLRVSIENWIDIYDNEAEKMLNDPKHIYADSSVSDYETKHPQYGNIYNENANDPSGQVKTGNNNNGLNGLYSGAGFGWSGNKRLFDTSFVETLDNKVFATATSIFNGWEHVVPQSHAKATWIEGSVESKKARGDFHNLRPSIQNLYNGSRGNNLFGIVPGDGNKVGVDFEVGTSASANITVAEPRVNVRGDIARMTFYMHDRYHIKYDLGYYKLLALWALMDPVTKEEKALDIKIAQVVGFSNEYVTGVKQIPYDPEIEKIIIEANKDTSKNTSEWAKHPGVPAIKTLIETETEAKVLDWTTNTIAINFGHASSKYPAFQDAMATKQLILKATMEKGGEIKYFKVTTLQSKAMLAKLLDDQGSKINVKININSPKTQGKMATLLTGGTNISYSKLTDFISKLEYKVIE